MSPHQNNNNSRPSFNLRATAWLMTLCVLILTSAARLSAQDGDTTRRLWDTAFINAAGKKALPRKAMKRSYRVATPNIPTADVNSETVVGVTLWRLRRAAASDSGERLIVHEGADAAEWLPERISANTSLDQGDRLRVSVEAARTGYLYVIDREQYADGSLGAPYLIFPTTRTLGGNNQVTIGKIVELPGQDDRPAYFTVKRSRSDQTAEVLSVLVSPTPLPGIEITDTAQKLSEEQLSNWEKSWGTRVGLLELEHGAGQPWSKAEKEAAGSASRALQPNAPAPQVIYYQPNSKTAEPIMVKVRLRYGTGKKH
ncbi:MAG: hypothetical protein QOD33_680 [Pyrinomonadaceae bacterium]|jgi:hypothetical protein|nr:hypothetical protein [Pyrinomonadaceae bacterium]